MRPGDLAPRAVRALRARPSLNDCTVLVVVVILSALLYVGGLGFYGDDWGYFSELSEARDQTLPGLIEGLYARDVPLQQRPVQLAYVATTYSVFGLHPLGYHLVGVAMLIAIALLLYGTVRELGQRRAFALSIALLYVLLPNYTGARLWFGAHTAILSIVFLVLSAYAALRALRAHRLFAAWAALAVASVVASGMAYEVTLPVFSVVVGVVGVQAARICGARFPSVLASGRLIALVVGYVLALGLVVAFKAYATERIGIDEPYLEYLARVARGSIQVNFGAYGVGLPYIISWIAARAPSAQIFGLAGVVGIVAGTYLAWLTTAERAALRLAFVRYVVVGLCVFVAGYVIFFVPTLVAFESAGRENRVGTAATIGVAILYTGVLAGVASLFRPRWRRAAFGTLVGILCAAAFVITNTQARFWVDAYEKQREIERRIASDVERLPHGGALILDGVCLQRGGAWVLTGARDLTGLLRLRPGREEIRAAAISRPVLVDSEGIHIKAFNDVAFFPYDENLRVYNYRRRATYRLRRQADAEAYLRSRQFRAEQECPTVFAWGLGGG
jgi:hypothetical protein